MHEIGILKVIRAKEEGLQTLFCARDDGGVVTKEQPAQDSHQDDAVEVAFVSVLLVHDYATVLSLHSEHAKLLRREGLVQ